MVRATNKQLISYGFSPSSKTEPPRLTELVANISFESYTPYMGGDFQTEHYQKVEVHKEANHTISRSTYVSGYPTAKSLLGKMRWLARVAVAQALCLTSHREAEINNETMVAWIKPARQEKPLRLSLLPLIFGAMEGLDERSRVRWRGLTRLIVEPQDTTFTTKGPGQLIDDDYVTKNRLMGVRHRHDKPEPKPYPTRFALLAMDKEEFEGSRLVVKGANIYPIKPRVVSFKATLYMEPPKRRCPQLDPLNECSDLLDVKVDMEDLKAFTTSLLITTPLLLGLGKGSTRGFGRFKPSEACANLPHDVSKRLKAFCTHLEEVLDPGADAKDIEMALKDLLGDLVVLAWRALGHKGEPKVCNFCGSSRPLIPRIYVDQNLILARVMRKSWRGVHSKMGFKHNIATSINEALAAIGYASLKLSWKIVTSPSTSPYTRPGLDLHTWPLGLPRHQKFPGRCRCNDKEVKPEDNPLRTGYLVGKRPTRKDFITTTENKCIEKYSGKYSNVVLWDDIGFDEEARRQSMLIAFPLPPSEGDGVDVAVIMLPAADMMSLLGDKGDKHLYHAGPYQPTSQAKPCLEPVISVGYAARNGGTIRKKQVGVYGIGTLDLSECTNYLTLIKDHAFKMFLDVLGNM